ncbi:glutamate--cysteine ligase [Streptomyces sp. SP17BM10]|uniref:carboxylate-amine ligase n=1 Tax=Streptomyces sp. SP17BM10 TaxID=3002530 RepID=UPI002E79E1C0|nr:glutamate--cysteine ligase [Streptomyces sp. SP17BM10]MEE1786551.1 glutamate--cysteine ligase [Streptomyces sp. SP17BM10]
MLTIGVEEEYVLIDPATGVPVARAADVQAAAGRQRALTAGEVQRELSQAQIEVATPVCHTLDEVGGHLLRLRHCLAQAARGCGCRLAATGSVPFTDRLGVPVTPSPRYLRLRRAAPALVDEQLINGMHVHVGVPDRPTGVRVMNGLRPWLPVLTALAANSPLWHGRDTGFASWRTVVNNRWPASGPPPEFAGAADYDRRIHALVDRGLIADTGQLYWQVRLSERYPTVEVRAMDVQLTVDEAVLLAGLVRGLCARAVTAAQRPFPEPEDSGSGAAEPSGPPEHLQPEHLQAAVWHAARHGTTGVLHAPLTGRPAPARQVAAALLARVDEALAATGDRDRAAFLLERLHRDGNGAVRQRRALRRGGRAALIALIVDETA